MAAALAVLVGCAAPAATPTPTTPPAAAPTPTKAAPTPTKAPTATPTKRPLIKTSIAVSQVTLTEAASFLGFAKGLYNEEGLDVEWVRITGGAQVVAALSAGDIDFVSASADNTLQAADKGAKIQMVATNTIGDSTQLVIRKDVADRLGITQQSSLSDRIKALKGLTILIPSLGGKAGRRIPWLVQQEGLDPERDIALAPVSSQGDQIAALARGAVDAMNVPPPASTTAIAQGVAVMLIDFLGGDHPALRGGLGNSISIRPEFGDRNPEAVEAMVRSLWRAHRYLAQDKSGAASDLKRFDVFAQMETELFRESLDASYPLFPKDPTLTAAMVNDSIRLLNEMQPEARVSITAEQVSTNRFVEAARKQLGF